MVFAVLLMMMMMPMASLHARRKLNDDDDVDGDGGELVSPHQKNAGGDYDCDTNNHDDGDSSLSPPQKRFVHLCRQ